MNPLPAAFFDRSPLEVAPDLLGKLLVHETNRGVVAGIVVETEAYTHDDPAFHGWGVIDKGTESVKPTGRAYDLFGPPGRSYIYLCYGTYWLLNVLTQREDIPGCVLIRAVQPVMGLDEMWTNRPGVVKEKDLANGPGKLTLALGIDKRLHRTDLTNPPLYFSDDQMLDNADVRTSTRIGLSRAIDRPWRYFVGGNRFVSPGVPSDIAARRRRKR